MDNGKVSVKVKTVAGAADRASPRVEGFNLFNHGSILGRAQTIDGDTGTAANALPALANIDPPRMVQVQLRYTF